MKNATAKRPTHRAYVVTKDGGKSFWREIGAVWAHDDGKGFNIKLDCLPLDGSIVIREPKDDAKEGGAQ